MTEKRGSFFRREKDSIRNILSQPLRSPDFSPLTYENAPGAARTRNLQLRRLTLYPIELRALVRDRIIICPSADHNRPRTPTPHSTRSCSHGALSPRLRIGSTERGGQPGHLRSPGI